ncbi:aromatic amino acid exporter YddG [Oceanicella actignis]|uniref:aromatic amino acid exporter YddG n=1 Tax=Oceanicella actignis TaxID=1189325 RepID=UPI0011E79A07|nr:DMT family transporter [Oceanicella actignis]TYO88149.1 drug/metabolite transporter (DMT)-like permease [Oceanicella actignis]
MSRTIGPTAAAAPDPAQARARLRATLIGGLAVALWSALALLTVLSGQVPPFQLTAMCLAIGGAAGAALSALRGGDPLAALRQRPAALALGIGGIFGYHFFYFTALRNAPAAEAGLIAYLWPLLIVLFSGLLPGERLRAAHLAGAATALAGAALIISQGGTLRFAPEHAAGFAAAGACALIWSGYSVLSRVAGHVPTDAVTGFCLAGAALSALCHLALERTVWPQDAVQWAATVGLGLGPLGLAFHAWDVGVKRGDIQLLGVAAYAAPLASTLALAAAGLAELTPRLLLAAALIAGGAALAAMGSRRR